MADKEPIGPPHDFKKLLKDADFEGIKELCKYMKEKWGTTIVSRPKLYDIQSGKNRKLRKETLEKFSEALSLKGKDIGVNKIKRGLNIKSEEDLEFTSEVFSYLISLTGFLNKKLEEIHYQKRIFKVYKDDSEPSEKDKSWTIEELLRREKHIIVIAEPGMGKSTLLDRISLLSVEDGRIPVYVDLKASSSGEFGDFKTSIWVAALSYKAQAKLKISKEDLKDQSFMFLFDHLDMVAPLSEEKIPSEIGHINILSAERDEKDDIFVVCCRANFDRYFGRLNDRFRRFTLLELDVKTDVPKLLGEYGIEKLHLIPEKNEQLLEFAKNPYRLKMLVEIYREKKKKRIEPAIGREVEIYEQFVELHLEKEESRWAAEESPEVKKAALACLAFENLTSSSPSARTFGRSWARTRLRTIIPQLIREVHVSSHDVKTAIREILAEGLILLSSDSRKYEFSHPSLGDFFCAWHLKKNLEKKIAEDIIFKQIGDPEKNVNPHWGKIIVFYSGLVDDATWLIETLKDEEKTIDDVFYSNLRLAGRCLLEAKYISDEILFDETLDRIIGTYINMPHSFVQWLLIKILKEIGGDKVTNWFVKNINNPDLEICLRSIYGLRTFGSEVEIDLLMRKTKDKDINIRHYAVYTLYHIGASLRTSIRSKIADLFIEKLNDSSIMVQRAAASCLHLARGTKSRQNAMKVLIKRLDSDDFHLRHLSIDVLGFLGDKEAIEPLMERAKDENWNYLERIAAMDSLKILGVDDEQFPEILVDCESHEDEILWLWENDPQQVENPSIDDYKKRNSIKITSKTLEMFEKLENGKVMVDLHNSVYAVKNERQMIPIKALYELSLVSGIKITKDMIEDK